ncbi:Hypothetical protein CINCED_3A009289 [Cinara cedri]|uniref:Uncharacterized protein n=1 Tax=Cinara cedri TaxID=506608 RepID=A0A5E4NHD5_9HEMI|nr:Hypothetical protein CINCED_3A009289 [Cinara cedri]
MSMLIDSYWDAWMLSTKEFLKKCIFNMPMSSCDKTIDVLAINRQQVGKIIEVKFYSIVNFTWYFCHKHCYWVL